MSKREKVSVTTEEVLEEARKYSSSQRRELVDDLETDIETLANSMANLYDEHVGVFLMNGVQVEVKLSVSNEVVYRLFLGCPEFWEKLAERAERLKKEVRND